MTEQQKHYLNKLINIYKKQNKTELEATQIFYNLQLTKPLKDIYKWIHSLEN